MSSNTPSDDAEKPVYLARRKGLEDFFTCSKDRYDELSALDLFETKITYLHPPKPAELELEEYDAGLLGYFGGGDVEWWQDYIRDLLGRAHDHYQSQVSAYPPKPVEPEAETIETLKAENFKLASGQCTEGGPWGDKGGTPYCKYAARKPMTAKEMLKGIDADTYPYEEVLAFVTGIRYAEKHHGIG